METKLIIIYHSRDLDGWCSGAILNMYARNILKLKEGEIKLIPYDYNESFDALQCTGKDVIMADVSMSMEMMQTILAVSRNFTWIDHHASSINKYYEHKFLSTRKLHCVFPEHSIDVSLIEKKSACELCWEYCFPDTPTPEAVMLLGEYDSWRNENEYRFENKVIPFQFGMLAICNSVDTFPEYAFRLSTNTDIIKLITNKGRIILDFIDRTSASKVAMSSFQARLSTGQVALCMNTSEHGSRMFKDYEQADVDLFLIFYYNDSIGWTVSMRSNNTTIDLSEIAAKFGGGGHRGAAGISGLTFSTLQHFLQNKLYGI